MRIALISISEDTADGPVGARRGLLKFAGRTLAERQVALALKLVCGRIICLTRGLPEGHFALQQTSEAGGAQFHFVETISQLSGLVRAADELFVFADGVLHPESKVIDALDARAGVLTIPAESGTVRGFQRIDADRAWAGALRTAGSDIERLAALPPDTEPLSALLRIAMQGGARLVPLPERVFADGDLAHFADAGEIDRTEPGWLQSRVQRRGWFAPGLAVLDWLTARFASALVAFDPAGAKLGAGAIVLSLTALLLAGLFDLAAAYAVLFVAAVSGGIADNVGRLAAPAKRTKVRPDLANVVTLVIDSSIFAMPLLAVLPTVSMTLIFPLAMLALLVLMARRALPRSWRIIAYDRPVMIMLLGIAAAWDVFVPFVQVAAAAVAVALLVAHRSRRSL